MNDSPPPPAPMPNNTDWLTIAGAAHLLGVSRRTVSRLTDRGVITAHHPYGGPGERTPVLFWRDQLNAVIAARTVLTETR